MIVREGVIPEGVKTLSTIYHLLNVLQQKKLKSEMISHSTQQI